MFSYVPGLVKKYIYEIIKEKYHAHEVAIDRCASHLTAQRDAQDFMELVHAVYKSGFEDAVSQYKSELKKIGYNVKIVGHEKEGV